MATARPPEQTGKASQTLAQQDRSNETIDQDFDWPEYLPTKDSGYRFTDWAAI